MKSTHLNFALRQPLGSLVKSQIKRGYKLKYKWVCVCVFFSVSSFRASMMEQYPASLQSPPCQGIPSQHHLDEQEIPALHLHHVPPVDKRLLSLLLRFLRLDASRCACRGARRASKASLGDTVFEERSERRSYATHRPAEQVDPNQGTVKAAWPGRDVLQDVRQTFNEVDAAGLGWVESRHKTAQVDARCEAESLRHVLGQLLRAQRAVGIEGHLGTSLAHLGEADLVTKDMDMLAQCNVVHAIALERFEAGNFTDEIHDAILAAHELAETE
ncbi:hypothetical protein FJTKL_05761 [Diaporthe vaccinii]|uniref:Uncharacterized protein n=1 Tax=Diaporthe vaccinii TaxID=105482 RepID=A0ABR4EXS9_9PEZI